MKNIDLMYMDGLRSINIIIVELSIIDLFINIIKIEIKNIKKILFIFYF